MGSAANPDTPIEVKAFHYWANNKTMISSVWFYSSWMNGTDNSTYVGVEIF